MSTPWTRRLALTLSAVSIALFGSGCSDDTPLGPADGVDAEGARVMQTGDVPPADLATVSVDGDALTLWPYTGTSFDGTPSDPMNVIFVGEAHPLQIRQALLALDGSRPGFPPMPPFNLPWTDVVGGDVQTAYTDGPLGWSGSIVQLTLGEYGPLRVHLRLFRTARPFGESGEWTVGAAHFELHIPGTADHQVLSWELAEQVVVADLVRTGLLDVGEPTLSSGPISAAPSFRTIPAVIYNGLPPMLTTLIGGPSQPVTADVPILNDGEAVVLRVDGSVPVQPGVWPGSASLFYDLIVPKPFCVSGPGEYLHIVGPIEITTLVEVSDRGRYTYRADYAGDLEVTAIDVSGGVPVPVGEPRTATVDGKHLGFLDEHSGRIAAQDRRMVIGQGGPEIRRTDLIVPENGRRLHGVIEQCIASQP